MISFRVDIKDSRQSCLSCALDRWDLCWRKVVVFPGGSVSSRLSAKGGTWLPSSEEEETQDVPLILFVPLEEVTDHSILIFYGNFCSCGNFSPSQGHC